MNSKKQLYHFHSLSRVLLVIGIVIVANILVSGLSFRADLTEAKLYTLSRSTKKILRSLDAPVTFKLYFSDSSELPEYLISVRRDVMDIVDEYKKAGKGKILIEKFNPKDDAKIQNEALSFGVPEIQFRKFGHKELKVSTGYSGLAMLHKSKYAPIPYVQNIANLEFEITAGILRMTQEKTPTLGVLRGHGEEISEDIVKELSKQYNTQEVNLSGANMVPKNIDGLIISGPKDAFSDREKYLVDQFVMRGGKLFAMLNGVQINKQTLSAFSNDTGLNTILEPYGVRVNTDVVLDPVSNEILVFQGELFAVPFAYPPYPKVSGSGINRENIITERLQSISFPFPSSLTILDRAKNESREITELLKTTNNSFTLNGAQAQLAPNFLQNAPGSDFGPKTLAAVIRGQIESAYQGKEIPALEKGKGALVPPDNIARTENGAVFVVSTNRMFIDENIRRMPESFLFLANALDVLVQNESLVDIRSRSQANRPIENITESRAAYIKYGNILSSFLLSALVGGIAYWYRRRQGVRARARYEGVL